MAPKQAKLAQNALKMVCKRAKMTRNSPQAAYVDQKLAEHVVEMALKDANMTQQWLPVKSWT